MIDFDFLRSKIFFQNQNKILDFMHDNILDKTEWEELIWDLEFSKICIKMNALYRLIHDQYVK